MNNLFKEIGKQVKTARATSGLTQREVAARLGYTSSQFVSNVERGVCSFPLKKLKRLETMIGLDMGQISSLLIRHRTKEIKDGLIGGRK